MAGCINQVENISLAILRLIVQPDSLCLDGNATLAFNIHIVEHLLGHVTQGNGIRILNQAVSESRFPMVNMGNNRKIPNFVTTWVSAACKRCICDNFVHE